MKRFVHIIDTFNDNSRYQYLLLLLITLLAVVLRFYKLGEWSFWGDEMITVRRAENLFNLEFSRWSISLILTRYAFNFLDVSEWSARLVPTLAGIATVPATYFLVKKMFGPFVALVTGLLLAVSPWHLYWSQNARFYSVLLLFYTLALLLFFLGIEKDRPWYLLLSLFFIGLATLERPIALFFGPVVVGYLILLKILPFEEPPGFRPRNLLLFFLPGLVPTLFLVSQFPAIREPSLWLKFFGWVNNSPFWILAGVVYYVGIPVICLGAFGALYLLTKKDRAALLLSLGALTPLLAIMVISLFQYTANRYVFVSLVSWLALSGVAVKELFMQAQKNTKILAAGVLITLLFFSLSEDVLYYQYQNGNRDDWKAAFEFVKQQKQKEDLVVAANPEIGDYYLQEKTVGMGGIELSQIKESKDRVWFVEDMNVEVKWPQVHSWLETNAHLVANKDVHVRARNFKMRVYLYDANRLTPGNVVSR